MVKRRISERLVIVILVLANLFLRFYRINDPSFAYFDEKNFYLPAAREILQKGVDPLFEHPPVSKLLFAFSTHVFGDNPLGWRFFPVIFATVSAVTVYFLARKLFGGRVVPTVATLLFSVDFGWFTSSRVAFPETIFAGLFLLASYFVIALFKETEQPKQLRWLLLGGLFFGLALATKWTALLGLPILLAIVVAKFKSQISTLVVSLGLILAVSLSVYLASYSLFFQQHNFGDFINLQRKMVSYHTQKVNQIVAQDSKLAELEKTYKAVYWPLNSIFSYRFENIAGGLKAVVFFYNPVVLWGALIATVWLIFAWVKKHKIKTEQLILAGLFVSFWLPWVFSVRIVYPYYWLAGIPFGAILLAELLVGKNKKVSQNHLGFLTAAIVLFAFYYPLLTNMPVKIWYFRLLTGTIGFR